MTTLQAYESLGYTPEELQLIFNIPQEIYVIEMDEDTETNKVMTLYLYAGNCVYLCGKHTFWNCYDEYGDNREIPLSGLNKYYFLTKEAAEAALKKL